MTSSWEDPSADEANIAWARDAWEALRPFSTGGAYINFMTEGDGDDRLQALYGKNFERLAAAKAKWDPTNLFRMNKNISPGSKD